MSCYTHTPTHIQTYIHTDTLQHQHEQPDRRTKQKSSFIADYRTERWRAAGRRVKKENTENRNRNINQKKKLQ